MTTRAATVGFDYALHTRTFIASLATAVALTGCSASAEESKSPQSDEPSPTTTSFSESVPSETTSTEGAEGTVAEDPTEPAGPVRARGWVGPEDGIVLASDVTDRQGAKAAANAALAFLRKWTLREDLMRADLRTAHTALAGVTDELAPNAAAAWQQALKSAADLENRDAWGDLEALIRVAATGPEWNIPANKPLVSNRTFLEDVFVTNDSYSGMRVGIDYSADLTKLADPTDPKAGYMRVTQETSLSLGMTMGPTGWQIFSWQGTFKAGDPVFLS